MEEFSPTEVAREFVEVSRQLAVSEAPADVLTQIVDLAVRTVGGCQDAGVLLVDRRRGTFETPAATSDLVRASDEAQIVFNEGPCVDAARHERSFVVSDMTTETRWQRYRPRAVELGIRSMMGFELFAHKRAMGALDLYSRLPNAFDEASREVGWLFASHAAIALTAAQRTHDMRAGYETRQEIGEAVGVLMERHRLSNEQAFELLREASMRSNVKLRDIAHQVVYTGQIPETEETDSRRQPD